MAKQKGDALTLGTAHCQRCNPSTLIIIMIICTMMKNIDEDTNYHDEYDEPLAFSLSPNDDRGDCVDGRLGDFCRCGKYVLLAENDKKIKQ